EQYIPRWDLTHVIDTLPASRSLEGHGTPTVILFGRNRSPIQSTVRVVMGIRGEREVDSITGFGPGWTAIVSQIDEAGSASSFVSVADVQRSTLGKHPWSIGGGGAAELKELLDDSADRTLGNMADSIGIVSFTLEDDIFLVPRSAARRHAITEANLREMV